MSIFSMNLCSGNLNMIKIRVSEHIKIDIYLFIVFSD